jgi:glycosyltransferase involved in cell wall biosynthesis
MIKTLFIAYYFPPVGGAGVQRALKFVQYLPHEGFLPAVITGPTSPDHRWTPQDRTLVSSIPGGVSVHRVSGRVPEPGGKIRGRLERGLGLSTLFSKWWIQSATKLAKDVVDGEAVIFATMSPFESGQVARKLSKQLGLPWVADLRDPWALDEMQVYPSFLHRRLEMARMERLLSTAALIVMNTPEAAAALKAAFPGLRQKLILTIPNGFDRDDFASPVMPRMDGKFRLVHSGYLHTANGVQLRKRKGYRLLAGAQAGVDILTRSHAVLLDALERWSSRHPDILDHLEIVFAGNTTEDDRSLVDKSGIKALVQFPGYLSHNESVKLVRTADLLFLPMHNLPSGRRSRIVPGKTYEYMASGRPILAAVPDGDARDFLSDCGTAFICRPDDATRMIEILEEVYTAWKNKDALKRSNEEFVYRFERRNLTRALAAGFESLLPDCSGKVSRDIAPQTALHITTLNKG